MRLIHGIKAYTMIPGYVLVWLSAPDHLLFGCGVGGLGRQGGEEEEDDERRRQQERRKRWCKQQDGDERKEIFMG